MTRRRGQPLALLGVLLVLFGVIAAGLLAWAARQRPGPVLQCVDADATTPTACTPSHFQTGDLLFLRGSSLRTHVVLEADPDSPYSHVGMIQRRGGLVLLLHAAPDPPVPHGAAVVRVEPLTSVLRRAVHAAVYRPRSTEAEIDVAGDAARSYLGRPFDADLDLDSDAAIYCTELVWRAWEKAGVELLPDGPAEVSTPFGQGTYALPSQLLDSQHFALVTRLRP